jgi:hypothetical protein
VWSASFVHRFGVVRYRLGRASSITMIPNSRLTTVAEGWHEWGLWYPEKFTSIILDFIQKIETIYKGYENFSVHE